MIALGWKELDSGERVDFDAFDLIDRRVHLGDDKGVVVLVLLAQLLPRGLQLLALTAPWRIELDKHILRAITRHCVEVLAHKDLHARCGRSLQTARIEEKRTP